MAEESDQDALEQLRRQILQFLNSCKRPILKEPGAEPLPVAAERFALELERGRLLLQAWDDRRSIVRRVTRLRAAGARSLDLAVQRFGGGEGPLTLAETSLRGGTLDRARARKRFLERFRKLLAQQFPGWKIERLSAERDLRRTFSEHYARAALEQGQAVWAAVGVAEAEGEATGDILTDGLLWLDYLRSHSPQKVVAGLHLFVPREHWQTTANRLAFLDTARAQYRLFTFSRADAVSLVEPSDYGNLRTELATPRPSPSVAAGARELLRSLSDFPGLEQEPTAEGGLSLRFRGLEFASVTGDTVIFQGMPLAPSSLPEARRALEELMRLRSPDSPARDHPFFKRAPERWMESLVKADVAALSSDLVPGVVYSQTLSVAGPARGVIDLLAATRAGRLVVIELKAEEDPHLPLQALDYWMRVKWHLERGDFQARGYFPGLELRPEPPLLWLVFPSVRLHATNEIILRYFSPAVPVTRVGLNEDWRTGIRIVFRM